MKKFTLPFLAIVLSLSLSGCGLMEDAFKAGLIFGLVIIAIIGLLIWILHFSVINLRKKFVFLSTKEIGTQYQNK